MKRLFVPFLVLAVLFFLGSSAYAQKGGRPSGTPGVTPASGASHSEGSSHSGKGNTVDAGKKTPDELLNQNQKLSDNLAALLKKMGVNATPQQACQNFKNLGQCVAAIHVSHNLGIDFNSLACDMTLKPVAGSTCPAGTGTGSKGMNLGQSIEALKPGTSGKTESQKAMKQANQDIKAS